MTFIKSHLPSVEVERKSWWTGLISTDLRNYLTNNMRAGRPTMVWYESPALHMVLFVGIEGDKFVIHDPGQGVYVRETWAMIEPRFKNSLFDGTGTLSFTSKAPDTSWNASLIIPFAAQRNNGLDFIATKPDGRFDVDSALVYSWYLPELMGPGLLNLTSMKAGSVTDRHNAYATVAITNIVDGSASKTFSVGLEIKLEGVVKYTHPETSVTLTGGVDQDVSLIQGARGKPVKELVTDPGDYTATFYVAEGGTRFDTVDIPFKVGKGAEPTACGKLTSEFRAGCQSGKCTCVGNAFCEGFQMGGVKSCEDATKACGFHCVFFDDGDCECDRYCTMFLSRIGCGG